VPTTDSATAQLAELPALPPGISTLTNEEVGWLRSRYPDLSPSPEQCPTCRGGGTFRWYAAGRRDPVAYRCPCPDQWLAEQVLLYAGIGRAYHRLDWEDYFDLPPAVGAELADYVARIDDYVQAGMGLLLHGRPGTGKTLATQLVLKRLVGLGVDCYSTSFTELIDSYADGWRSDAGRSRFDRRVRNARVLVVDEVGREYKGSKGLADTSLETVLRHRAQHCLPTLLASNLGPSDVAASYGGHSMSLLTERCIFVEFTGTDRRPDHRQRMIAELRAGLTRPVVI
jgi:DNA replication protein DnaC